MMRLPQSLHAILFCFLGLLLFNCTANADTTDFSYIIKQIQELKLEFTTLSQSIENQYRNKFSKIEQDYYFQINLVEQAMPEPPKPKDMFETQFEYSQRMSEYKKRQDKAEIEKKAKLKKIKQEYNLRYLMAVEEVKLLKEKLLKTEPVIRKLEAIQNKRMDVDDEDIDVMLFEPEPDKSRFPIHFITQKERFQKYWEYKDREQARVFWNNRSFLRAQKQVQFECSPNDTIQFRFTTIHVTNAKTGDNRDFVLDKPSPCKEVTSYYEMKDEALPAAELMVALKDVVKGPVADMNFIFISPRSFMMGSPRNESGRWANETLHRVKLTQGFYIQTTEVTQGQWRDIMGYNPSHFSRCGSDCPVENVYWGDVMEFIGRLNKREGTDKYRLPTEAEWEFACRAGSMEMWCFGNDSSKLYDYAWIKDNSEDSIHPVAQLNPNAWGLYDMHGNVSEWCSDWSGPYPDRDVTDPKGPFSGKFRVARGGNWFFAARSSRSADRNQNLPGDRCEYVGFRVVKSP